MPTKYQKTDLVALNADREVYRFSVAVGGVAKDLSAYTVTGRIVSDAGLTLATIPIADLVDGSAFATGKIVMILTSAIVLAIDGGANYSITAVYGDDVQTVAHGRIVKAG